MTREILTSGGIYQDSKWIVNEPSNCAVPHTRSHCTEKILQCWYNHVQCSAVEKTSRFLKKKNQLWLLIAKITLIFFFGLRKEAFKKLLLAINQTTNWLVYEYACLPFGRWIGVETGKDIYCKSRIITMNFSEIIFGSMIFEYFWIPSKIRYTNTFWISYRFSKFLLKMQLSGM